MHASLVEIARDRASRRPGGRAYLYLRDGERDEEELDFAGLDRRARRVAAALQVELGDPRGQRVLLLHPPGLELIGDFLGCLYAGAIAVPTVPPRANRSMERTQALALDSGAALVLSVASVLAERERLVQNAPALDGLRWLASDALPEGGESAWREVDPAPDELAFLQYTSGSTGSPKGVAVSHRNLLHNEELLRIAFRNGPDSTLVSWLPLHHDMGLIGMVLQSLFVGAPLVLMSPAHFLARPARWLEAIARHRGTMSCAPNFAYDLCAQRVPPEQAAELDLSSWTMAVNGSEPVRLETLERFARAFTPCGFRPEAMHPGFGLAEGTLIVSLGLERPAPVHGWFDADALGAGRAVRASPGAPGAKPVVGCGTTMPTQEVAIVDPDTRRRRPSGEVGEIWVRGESVATGYWNRPEESERTFRARLAGSGRARLAPSDEGPFLRTGDLGFLEDGELFVTGRLKDMVIVRGQNHYPQDLELAVERCHPDLRSFGAAAFAVELEGREALVVVAEVERRGRAAAPEVLAAARGALSEACEVEAAAVALIRPGSLPRTSSGKLQRAATRAAWLRGELPLVAEWRAPTAEAALEPAPAERTPEAIQAWLARQVAAALGAPVETIDPAAPLATLGLDSLRAFRLSHRVERELGVPVPLHRLYDGASLADVARDACAVPVRAQDAGGTASSARLSYGQRSLWFLHRLAPESAAYNLSAAARVLSPLDPAALERALAALVRRHAALRTTIVEGPDGEPRALLREDSPATLESVDASGWSDAELRERAAALARRPFDLERGPLLRVTWLRRGGEPDALLLGAHHVALDHWSLALVLSDLARLYAAAGREADLPTPSPLDDFAARQRAWLDGPEGEAAWRFWSDELADAPEPAEPSADRRRPPVQRHRGRTLRAVLEPDVVERLTRFARERGVTPYLVALTAFEVLLARATGRERFLFGTLSSGRAAARDAEVVGYLVNPVVLRGDASGAPTFDEVLERARRRAARCFRHADFPFPLLVQRLRPARDASRPPFFQTLFVWQHAHQRTGADLGALALGLGGARVELGGLALESLELEPGTSQYDLSLTLAEVDGGRLALSLEVDADLLDEGSGRAWLRRYVRVLEGALERPGDRVAELPLDDGAEHDAVLAGWRGAELDPGEPVHRALAWHAARTPDAVALECGARRVTYGELRARVDRLARRLIDHGVGPESVVAVLSGRSIERCVALLAVNAAGAAWMPVDPALPEARRRFLVEDARAALVLAPPSLADAAPGAVLVLDESGAIGDEPPLAAPDAPDAAGAYVIHTSGSTGAPKGVVVGRASLAAHARCAIAAFGITRDDAVLHMASVAFDVSVEELFPALVAGARVVLREESAPPSADELHELVERAGVTVVDLPTAYWHVWTAALAAARRAPPACLRLVIVGGERASSAAWAAWRSVVGERPRWINSYGPTEATVTATAFEPGGEHDPEAELPIGRAVPGWRVGVLDEGGRPASVGVPGELAIGGPGVARGYLGHPRLTARVFVPDPTSSEPGARLFLTGDRARWRADGQLEFLGRRDEQVKVHGFRVEPAEVEAELARAADVREVVVVPRADGDGATRLVAYAVTTADPEELRRRLRGRLPHYLVPARVVRLDALPRTSSGKIDRRALPEPPPLAGDGAHEPRGAAEEVLARAWRELLGVERVGRRDDFFELGGDSIRSIQLAARAGRAGLRLSPEDVFLHPRLEDLARAARALEREPSAPTRGPVPLTPIQRWFFDLDLERPEHWNQHVLLEVDRPPSLERLRAALLALARRHDALCLRFRREDGAWRAEVGDPERAVRVDAVDPAQEPEPEAAFEREVARAQAGLDLERGPLLRAVAFAGAPSRLLLVAHHLVVDAVSWPLLVDELERALADLEHGAPPHEETPPTAWSTWARWIDGRSRAAISPGPHADDLDAPPAPLRLDGLGDDPGCERDERVLERTLDLVWTERLELAGRRARGADEELLVAALAAALAEVSGRAEAWIELEAHGRSTPGAPDVARTVGWFTELHAVRIDLAGASTPAERLRAVREDLRASRRRARARWLARRRGDPAPDVSFNYLGRLDGSGRGRLRLVRAGRDRAPSARRSHLLEIDARVEGGQLRVDWCHPASARAAVERLARSFERHLGALLDAAEDAARPAFGLAELDEGELARVLDQVDPLDASGGDA